MEDKNIYKKVESVYKHPVTGEEEHLTIQTCYTEQEKKDITDKLGISFDDMLNSKLNDQMKENIEEREYNDFLNYCKDNDRYKKVKVSTEHCINDIIKSFITTIELNANTILIGSVGLMSNIIKPIFKCIGCKIEDNTETRLAQFNFSMTTCKLITTNDYGIEQTSNVDIWIRPYLKYDDSTLLIINQNDKYFSKCIEFDFEDESAVIDELHKKLYLY